jgi:hypothetical protein
MSSFFENASQTLKQQNVKYSILCLFVVHIILIKRIPKSILDLYVSIEGRIIAALLVAYLAHAVPFLAIALTVTYIVTLQESRKRIGINESIVKVNIEKDPRKDSVKSTASDIDSVISHYAGKAESTIKDVVNTITAEEETNEAAINDNRVPEDMGHPADKTLTDNIQLEHPQFRDLDAVQTNEVSNEVEVRTEVMSAFGKDLESQESSLIKGFDSIKQKLSRV